MGRQNSILLSIIRNGFSELIRLHLFAIDILFSLLLIDTFLVSFSFTYTRVAYRASFRRLFYRAYIYFGQPHAYRNSFL